MVKWTRLPPTQRTRRDAWVDINLTALEDNARAIRGCIPESIALMAILKADGYGHGTVMLIPTLEAAGVSMIGVASMDEAIQIREAGLTIPILVIGPTPDWAIQVAADYDVAVTVFAENHIASIQTAYQQKKKSINVHIKVDTGMHRIGVPWQQANEFIARCNDTEGLKVDGIFSHLACADDPDMSHKQLKRFNSVLDQLEQRPKFIHLANSAGALFYHNEHFNVARLGIAFLGYTGHQLKQAASQTGLTIRPDCDRPTLKPVMGLKARIVHLQTLLPDEGVSYGHAYKAKDSTRIIATLPLGYADGVPRGLSNKLKVIIQGQVVPQVGNITMDQLMIDVTGVADVQVGDTVTLLDNALVNNALENRNEGGSGTKITLTDWANTLNTIEYELMCGLRVRLPKVYSR